MDPQRRLDGAEETDVQPVEVATLDHSLDDVAQQRGPTVDFVLPRVSETFPSQSRTELTIGSIVTRRYWRPEITPVAAARVVADEAKVAEGLASDLVF